MNQWQPIETAPTDRDILAVAKNGFIQVAAWHFKRKEWYNPTCAKGRCSLSPLTHWLPLPNPPSKS